MIKVTYRDHTVELISTQDPDKVTWSPKATVTFVGLSETITRPLRTSSRSNFGEEGQPTQRRVS